MINDPKEYYRKLDSFFSEIYQVGSDNVLSTVLKELVDYLGKDLHIKNGRLYELVLDKFVLFYCANLSQLEDESEKYLSVEEEAVKLVLEHGCYIFYEPETSLKIQSLRPNEFKTMVAFTIQRDEGTWLFVFELEPGWDREEIEFSINTTRRVLNSRISTESFETSLHKAELIQRSLLPKSSPKIEGFDIYGKSISTEIVGGDLYDYVAFSEGHFGVAVGDASGHGLPAALLVRDVVTGLRMGLEKEMKITPVLEKLNKVIHRSTLSTAFISLFYAEIDTNGDIVYANAGHPPPILINGNNVEFLKRGGTILGPLPEVQLKRGFSSIEPGGLMVMYSDGIFERQNLYGEAYEISKLQELAVNNQCLSAENLVKDIIDEVYNFGGQKKWKDDATVVVVKRLEKKD